MRVVLLLLAAVALLGAGCGDDGEPSDAGAEVETTEQGTKKVAATDDEAGLKVEVQDDLLFVTLTANAPEKTRELKGELIGGGCEDDGRDDVEASSDFPVLWRERSGDWGSAFSREGVEPGVTTIEGEDLDEYRKAEDAKPRLAEHVTRCELFAPGRPPGTFDPESDEPIATVEFR